MYHKKECYFPAIFAIIGNEDLKKRIIIFYTNLLKVLLHSSKLHLKSCVSVSSAKLLQMTLLFFTNNKTGAACLKNTNEILDGLKICFDSRLPMINFDKTSVLQWLQNKNKISFQWLCIILQKISSKLEQEIRSLISKFIYWKSFEDTYFTLVKSQVNYGIITKITKLDQ